MKKEFTYTDKVWGEFKGSMNEEGICEWMAVKQTNDVHVINMFGDENAPFHNHLDRWIWIQTVYNESTMRQFVNEAIQSEGPEFDDYMCLWSENYIEQADIQRGIIEIMPIKDPVGANILIDFTDGTYRIDLSEAKEQYEAYLLDHDDYYSEDEEVLTEEDLKSGAVKRFFEEAGVVFPEAKEEIK